MDEELQKARAFAELIERRTGVHLDDAEAHAMHLRLVTLYRVLIRKPPRERQEDEDTLPQVETEVP